MAMRGAVAFGRRMLGRMSARVTAAEIAKASKELGHRGASSVLGKGAGLALNRATVAIEDIRKAVQIDAQIKAIDMALRLPLNGTDWRLTGDDPEQNERVEWVLRATEAEGGSRTTIEQALGLLVLALRDGHSALEAVYGLGGDGTVMLRDLAWRPPETLRFRQDAAGHLVSAEQTRRGGGDKVEIPAEKLVRFVVNGDLNPHYGVSHYASAFQHAQAKWKMYFIAELWGGKCIIPSMVGRLPRRDFDGEGDTVTLFQEILDSIGTNASIILPEDWQLELQEVKNSGLGEALVQLIQHHDAAIAKSALAGWFNQGSEGRSGSYASGIAQSSAFFLQLQGVYSDLEDIMTQQVVARIVAMNGWLEAGVPRFELDSLDSDKTAFGEALTSRALTSGTLPRTAAALDEWALKRLRLTEVTQLEDGRLVIKASVVRDEPVVIGEHGPARTGTDGHGRGPNPPAPFPEGKGESGAEHGLTRTGTDGHGRGPNPPAPFPEGKGESGAEHGLTRTGTDGHGRGPNPPAPFPEGKGESGAGRFGVQDGVEGDLGPVMGRVAQAWVDGLADHLGERAGVLADLVDQLAGEMEASAPRAAFTVEIDAIEAAVDLLLEGLDLGLSGSLKGSVRGAMEGGYTDGAQATLRDLLGDEAADAFALRNEQVLAQIAERVNLITEASVEAVRMSRGEIAQALADGIRDGLNPRQIARQITAVFDDVARERALLIARTEAHVMVASAGHETLVRSGVGRTEWLAYLDSETRPDHREMHGKRRTLPDAYPNGDKWPGQQSPYNCRCTEFGVIGEGEEIVGWDGT